MNRTVRRSARILLLDASGRILLFRLEGPGWPSHWATPGGGIEPGETAGAAARRELLEETGLDREPGPAMFRRRVDFDLPDGTPATSDESWFRVKVPAGTSIDVSRHTALEREIMREWRWFTRGELVATTELVYPADLPDLM